MIKIGENNVIRAYLGRKNIKQITLPVAAAPSNCFYDKIGKQFFEAQNGSLIFGEDADGAYLENTANAIINTGIFNDQTTKVEIEFAATSAPQLGYIYGGFYAGTARYGLFIETLNRAGYAFGSVQNTTAGGTINLNQKYKFTLSQAGYYIDDVLKATPAAQPAFQNMRPAGLFADVVETNVRTAGKMYGAKIWQNNTLVMDLIPIKKGNIIMQDIVFL